MGKYENDLNTVNRIYSKVLAGTALSSSDRVDLLNVVNNGIAFHKSGKIEDLFSVDSSASGCEFCSRMRKCAENNLLFICRGCYDFAQEQYKINAKNRHALTAQILSTFEFTIDEMRMLGLFGLVRFNSSGDVVNAIHARNYVRMAYAHPETRFTLWAKNVQAVNIAFDDLGKPANMIFIQSSPLIGFPAKRSRYADYTFTVYPDKETTEKAIAGGCMPCNGRKCKECGFACYKGSWAPGSDIAELLRCSKTEREKILQAYNERVMRSRG